MRRFRRLHNPPFEYLAEQCHLAIQVRCNLALTQIPILLITGPTASGKSGLALKLAEELNGVVINADSMQVYKDLRILTARPSADDEARVPHRLYGYRAGADGCTAAAWAEDTAGEITERF